MAAQPQEMMDGLSMAETTPGPLIMVVQFVGFMGAYRNPGAFAARRGHSRSGHYGLGHVCPLFSWIFLCAPYIRCLRGNLKSHAALSSITAAVVGVCAEPGDLVRHPCALRGRR